MHPLLDCEILKARTMPASALYVWDLAQRLACGWSSRVVNGWMSRRYLPVSQINLVPQHHHGVGLLHRNGFGQNITPPGFQGFEGLQVSDIKSQDTAIRAFVECRHHGAESLLAACVPDLEGKEQWPRGAVMSG